MTQAFDENEANARGLDRNYIVELDADALGGRDLTKLDLDDALLLVNEHGVQVHRLIVGEAQVS